MTFSFVSVIIAKVGYLEHRAKVRGELLPYKSYKPNTPHVVSVINCRIFTRICSHVTEVDENRARLLK